MRRRHLWLPLTAALLTAVQGRAEQRPVTVSPGSATGSVIGARCPTFSWDPVERAEAHELVVYRVGREGKRAEHVLRERIPGSASSWTPPVESCLVRGRRYAWSVRAVGRRGLSDWSDPSLFQIAPAPTAVELEEALDLVRRYLAAVEIGGESGPEAPAEGRVDRGRSEMHSDGGGSSAEPEGKGASGVQIRDDGITVSGADVVTTATDQDTLSTISCSGSQILKWNDALARWQCGSDSLQQLNCVDGSVTKHFGTSWQCGTDSVMGHQTVIGDTVTCGPSSVCEGTVSCPPGKIVVSGGAQVGTLTGVRMVSSYPASSTQWRVWIRNNQVLNNRSFQPMAVCVLAP